MEINLSPSQMFLALALQVWMYVIFPVLVLKKLNYLTAILEAQFEDEPSGPDGS